MTNSIYQSAIVRFYNNLYFGRSGAPRSRKSTIYNGSVEFPDLGLKAWVDFPNIETCQSAFNREDFVLWKEAIWALAKTLGYKPGRERDFLAGQLMSNTQPKTYLDGVVVADMERRQLVIVAQFDNTEDPFHATLPITYCVNQDPNKKAPDLIASNCQLPSAGSEVKTSSTLTVNPMSMVNKLRATAV